MSGSPTLKSRFLGCLVGLSVGDAIGTPVGGMTEEQVLARCGRLRDQVGTQTRLVGHHADVTAMTLCVARSLVEHESVVPCDIAERLIGYAAAESGGTDQGVVAAMDAIRAGGDPAALLPVVWSKGERQGIRAAATAACTPVALLDCNRPGELIADSRRVCRLMRGEATCEWSCVAVNAAIAHLLDGGTSVVEEVVAALGGHCSELRMAVEQVKQRGVSTLRLDGADRDSTALATVAALAALLSGQAFGEALTSVASKGGSADRNAAVAGALLGARDGYDAIPVQWREGLSARGELEALATALLAAAASDAEAER